MLCSCVAHKCNTTTEARLHFFPETQEIRDLWCKFVSVKIPEFEHTQYSLLCEKHFTTDAFEVKDSVDTAPVLKSSAIPSIYNPEKYPSNEWTYEHFSSIIEKQDQVEQH